MKRMLALLTTLIAILAFPVPLVLAQRASPAGGTCPEFNGRDSFLTVESGKLADTKLKDITVEAWICLRSFPEEGEEWVIAAKPGTFQLLIVSPDPDRPEELASANCGYSFEFHTDGKVPLGKIGISWSGAITWHPTLDLNEWYHVSASFEDSSAETGLSINGEAYVSNRLFESGDPGDLVNTLSPFYIGGKPVGDSCFDGFIDEVRISDVARYKSDFDLPIGVFGMDEKTLALWHFDKDKGFFSDSSGNGNTLTGKNVGFLAVEPTGKLPAAWAGIKSGL